MKWIFLSVFLLLGILAFSQDSTSVFPDLKLQDISLRTGFYFQGYDDCGLKEFRNLMGKSTILKTDLSKYEEGYEFYEYGFIPDAGGSVSMNVGFNFFRNKKQGYSNTQIRAGLSYYWNNYFSTQLISSTTVIYDSVEYGEGIIYYDSVASSGYFMRHDWKQLNVDVSILFTSPPRKYISFAGGVGISAGLIFNGRTSVDYTSYIDTVIRGTNNSQNNNFYFLFADHVVSKKSESVRNKNGVSFIVYVPMEMSFNLRSQNHPFFRRIHFSLDINPGLHLIYLPETGTKTGFNVPFLAGMRYTLGKV